jgi:uncharacterized protein (UPF0218 family)
LESTQAVEVGDEIPNNIISINAVPEHNVSDSKMDRLIRQFEKVSYPVDSELRRAADKINGKCNPDYAYTD